MKGRGERGSGSVAGVAGRRSIMVNSLVCESNETCWSAARGPVGHRGSLGRGESGTPPTRASSTGRPPLVRTSHQEEVISSGGTDCCSGRRGQTASRRIPAFITPPTAALHHCLALCLPVHGLVHRCQSSFLPKTKCRTVAPLALHWRAVAPQPAVVLRVLCPYQQCIHG